MIIAKTKIAMLFSDLAGNTKLRGLFYWKFLGMYIIVNFENLEKSWVQKLRGHGVFANFLLF